MSEPSADTERPHIFDHADFRRYLDAWFNWKKQHNSRFSHRLVSRLLKTSDPSALKNIIEGRRPVTPERADALVQILELEDEAAEYFLLLVRFQQAPDRDTRQLAWMDIAALRSRLRSPEIDSSRFLYLSNWVYSAVRELATCTGFRPDPEWIAGKLKRGVTPESVLEALELLERLGFLVWRDGELVQAEPTVKTSQYVTSLGSRGFHQDTHRLAGEALDILWTGDLQHALDTMFLGVMVPVKMSRLKEIQRLLWEAQLKILEASEDMQDGRDRLIQVNLHMFPVSELLTDDPEEPPSQ